MTIAEQIKALLDKRAKALSDMDALIAATGSGEQVRNFTLEERGTFDAAELAVKELDEQLSRLRAAEAAQAREAVPVAPPPGMTPPAPAATPGVVVNAFKPFKGQGFVRLAMAVANTKGNYGLAAEYANRWKDQTPEVGAVLRAIAMTGEMPTEVFRAAVAAGTATNATWAGPLVYAQNLATEFIEFLRPQTLVGKLPLRPIPFNVSIPRQTAGVMAGWVGEGISKPVGALAFDRLSIPWAKMAVISVITQELAKLSSPSAEMLVRDDLAAAIQQYLDQQFIDPAVAASAGVRPGAITNGATAIPSTGTTATLVNTDLTNAVKALANANIPMTSCYWIMSEAARITIANLMTTQEMRAFPEMGQGMLKGYPVISSNNVPTTSGTPDTSIVVFVDAAQVLHAEDPAIDVTSSTEASLQMDSAPATPATPLVSMFQQNMMAIKAEQYQYWVKRYSAAVSYVSGFPVE